MAVTTLYVANALLFTQKLKTNPYGLTASNRLSLVSTVTPKTKPIGANSALYLQAGVKLTKTINLRVANGLGLTNRVDRPKFLYVYQTLGVWQQMTRRTDSLKNTLIFQQTVLGFATRGGTNTLVMSQTVALQIQRSLQPASALNLVGGASGYKLDTHYVSIPRPSIPPGICNG